MCPFRISAGEVCLCHDSFYSCAKLQAYEKQKNEKKTELAELSKAAKESKVKNFLDKEMSIVSKPLNPFDRKAGKCGGAEDLGQGRVTKV